MARPVAGFDSRTPEDRRLISAIGGTLRWAKTPGAAGRRAGTDAARAARAAQFERQADPDGVMTPAERAVAAACLRRAHALRMARKSAAARRGRTRGAGPDQE